MSRKLRATFSGFRLSLAVTMVGCLTLACNLSQALEAATPTAQSTPTAAPSTPSATEQAAQAAGAYFCHGHEGGLLAAAGTLTLHPDGRAVDVPAPGLGGERREGTWTYEFEGQQIEFSGEIELASAKYSLGSGRLVVQLAEGVSRPHAEQGILACTPR